MSLEFIFEDPKKTDFHNLHQGDILRRNDALVNSLSQAHGYYASAEDYTHFMVLTQSCDLQLRRGKPKARYISLAAIRPLDIFVERLIQKYSFGGFDFPVPVCDKNQEILVRQILERLLHNTQDGLFFYARIVTHQLQRIYVSFCRYRSQYKMFIMNPAYLQKLHNLIIYFRLKLVG